MLVNGEAKWHLLGLLFFFPGEAVPPLPNALQEEELFLPVGLRGSSDHAAQSWDSPLLPHQSTTMPARHNPGNVTDL